ncbi:heme-thiolate peroxidase [Leucocoprinus birnbaumii]|uniref:Heme-thiolate peroxidase n=1 Tax=Leucocoprinus birnbaumii TaxID=56174 RepID=A0AAD5YTT3_9AGAR|nr:heme-thiolate peroxidase [Leucocoprinus birnbaumii]
MSRLTRLVALALFVAPFAGALPEFSSLAHRSLAGLSTEELNWILPRLAVAPPENPPGPLNDTSAKLVNDAAHPWRPLAPNDIRGPCPGLNTLASHGYLPRSGIATPAQIITAAMEGFNMENSLARFVTYAAFLVDGNPVTNLLSIGGKSSSTGQDPPKPAIVGGLDTHAVFEGDASMTRADAFFGDNHSFNQTLWDEFAALSNQFGAGKYNLTVAGELRIRRIQDSIATNPTFSFVAPRYFTAYAESVFPINFFIDGRQTDKQLDLDDALSFFRDMKFPDGFFRAGQPSGAEGLEVVAAAHPVPPGANTGTLNSYTPDPTSADFSHFCLLYVNFVNQTIKSLYPNPTGVLRDALNRNLDFLYEFVDDPSCPQVFPFAEQIASLNIFINGSAVNIAEADVKHMDYKEA